MDKNAKAQIVRQTLQLLRERKLLKEENFDNDFTTNLQTLQTALSSITQFTGQLRNMYFDEEPNNILDLIDGNVKQATDIVNNMTAKSTQAAAETQPVQESDEPSVKMSTDSVIDHPDDVKQMSDKGVEVTVTDDSGKPLSEGKKKK